VNQLLTRFAEAQKMMRQMGGMMGLPGMRRKATKSPKNKRKGTKGGGRPRAGTAAPGGGGIPGGGGVPSLPPGFDPTTLDSQLGDASGLPPGYKLPKLDFSKLTKRDGGTGR
jgi:signal recognition particle subunit SRP54